MKTRFPDPLILEFDYAGNPEKPFIIRGRFRFFTELVPGGVVTAEDGYRTDFASIPWLFRRILPKAGSYGKAAVPHDVLCDENPHSVGYKIAAAVFYEAMEILNVKKFIRKTLKKAVLIGGPKFTAGQTKTIEPNRASRSRKKNKSGRGRAGFGSKCRLDYV